MSEQPPPRPQLTKVDFHTNELVSEDRDRWGSRAPLEAPYDAHEIAAKDEVGSRDAGEPHPERNAMARHVLGLSPLYPPSGDLEQLKVDLAAAKEKIAAGYAMIHAIEKQVRELEHKQGLEQLHAATEKAKA